MEDAKHWRNKYSHDRYDFNEIRAFIWWFTLGELSSRQYFTPPVFDMPFICPKYASCNKDKTLLNRELMVSWYVISFIYNFDRFVMLGETEPPEKCHSPKNVQFHRGNNWEKKDSFEQKIFYYLKALRRQWFAGVRGEWTKGCSLWQ
jgi:hypothetical protein